MEGGMHDASIFVIGLLTNEYDHYKDAEQSVDFITLCSESLRSFLYYVICLFHSSALYSCYE